MSEFSGDATRAARQWLADWRSAGLTHVPHVVMPVEAAKNSSTQESETERAASQHAPQQESPSLLEADRRRSNHTPEVAVSGEALSREQRESALQAVAVQVAECQRCAELAEARTQTVFGVGNPEADVMFIGEAPGAEEDAQGEPFVGRAGQLLNRIIEACGWQREDIYICNILRCRPPGNRNPTPTEAANCREYLDAQIRLVAPDFIVCWGSVAAHNLLDETRPIGKLREKWFKYGRAKVLCTYHPSYLLRNPAAKKPVWDDMKLLLGEMGIEPPAA